jgi:hypothetical protein
MRTLETLLFLALLATVYVGSRLAVEYYFKKKENAWKNPSPLLGVVRPDAKSQKEEEEK